MTDLADSLSDWFDGITKFEIVNEFGSKVVLPLSYRLHLFRYSQ